MAAPEAGWAWFEQPPAAGPGPDETARLFARCFAGGDGEQALGHLRAATLERCLPPQASEAELRHMEGRRQLALYIIALVARGRGLG